MLELTDWKKAWDNALTISPAVHYRDIGAGWNAYWDYIAEMCCEPVMCGDPMNDDVIRYLYEEGMFKPRDTVLDIGCGTGTYAIPFARDASHVTGLDPSGMMISKLLSAAYVNGLTNISPVQSRWETFDLEKKYDLVFSAFCPGINDTYSLFRMEKFSRRSCCYVAGDFTQFELLVGLWNEVMEKSYTIDAFRILYPYNVLCDSGRDPKLKVFRYRSGSRAPAEEVTEEFVRYFGAFTLMDAEKVNKVRDFIHSRSVNGKYELGKVRTVCVLHWDVSREKNIGYNAS
ncbi:class I SAM-dependent methyltransferase [Methanooceanicella nereidis]|nr:class I SAM-dependent methyltransferase [Methanocella sp. CWC-04]